MSTTQPTYHSVLSESVTTGVLPSAAGSPHNNRVLPAASPLPDSSRVRGPAGDLGQPPALPGGGTNRPTAAGTSPGDWAD